ncbi:hypothetical protein CFC21_063764 [Triticum aestivum]|uniref:Nucleolar protein 58/56 N-terminal domain-containing protein n=2 Tax=Triticum aestivum TaxID=4565 RepID=A0A3B6KBX8_WHEAT|nr:hypothetical protein CFC21_063764 [Triticum aestivum]
MGRRLLLQWRGLALVCKRKRRRTRSRDPSLANYGDIILVLFETPSGFAIFCFKEGYLKEPNTWQIFGEHFRTKGIVWLKEFQIFKDKSSAIDNCTGVSRELTEMISRCHHPCQKLAVGKPEYKTIIETSLPGVPCLFDETVMEVMWGLKHLMHSLVPQEKLKLTKEDRLPMSQGLKMFLYHYGFDVKPELVNEQVVIAACLLLDAGLLVESHSEQLRWAAGKLKEVSGINPEGWSAMKTATALRIMFDPAETTNEEMEIFTEEEVSTLEMTCHKYEDIIYKDFGLKIHSELVEMREVKKDALGALGFLLGSSV